MPRYASKYRCPQIFCFDGRTLLLLQFKATVASDIKSPDCIAECWAIPRVNPTGVSLRHALYRFLAQGFRRCQGMCANEVTINETPPSLRQFYNGQPLWNIDGDYHAEPWGYRRVIDPSCGAFHWTKPYSDGPLLPNGSRVYETAGFWGLRALQAPNEDRPMELGSSSSSQLGMGAGPLTADDEDIYSAN